MKKFFIPLIFLSFLTTNLYSQREVVIETFDDIGSFSSEHIDSLKNIVFSAEGGIKIFDVPGSDTYLLRKFINYVGKLPDSIKYRYKHSIPPPNEHRIIFWFHQIDYASNTQEFVGWAFSWPELLGDSLNWSTISFPPYNGTPGTNFNHIELKFEIMKTPDNNYEWQIWDDVTLVYNSSIYLTQPIKETKWFSGENEYIKFSSDDSTDVFRMEYSSDGGSSYTLIADSIKASNNQYEWLVPEVATTKARVRITSLKTGDIIASDNFSIKPYMITRLDNNGDYIAYDIDLDRWSFGNTRNPNQVWPVWWWLRFNYPVNIDPFTNKPYSQRQGDSTFARAHMEEFPDWISFVNTFSVDRCYRSTTPGIYSHSALMKWNAIKTAWGGAALDYQMQMPSPLREEVNSKISIQTFQILQIQ